MPLFGIQLITNKYAAYRDGFIVVDFYTHKSLGDREWEDELKEWENALPWIANMQSVKKFFFSNFLHSARCKII